MITDTWSRIIRTARVLTISISNILAKEELPSVMKMMIDVLIFLFWSWFLCKVYRGVYYSLRCSFLLAWSGWFLSINELFRFIGFLLIDSDSIVLLFYSFKFNWIAFLLVNEQKKTSSLQFLVVVFWWEIFFCNHLTTVPYSRCGYTTMFLYDDHNLFNNSLSGKDAQ